MNHFQKTLFSFFAFLCVLALPAMAQKKLEDGDLIFSGKVGDYFHLQGNCSALKNFETVITPSICPQGKVNGIDLCKSTWSCPGDGKDMLKFKYHNGPQVCAWINNKSVDTGYFVPLNTFTEWDHFSNDSITPADVEIIYGCPSMVKTDPCGNQYSLPDVPLSDNTADIHRFTTTGDYAVEFTCPATYVEKDKFTGRERTVAIANCGDWQIKGEFGTCLQQASFTFNGKACNKEARPTEFVIVLDASASMDQLLGGAQNGLRSLVGTYLVPRPDIPLTITAIGGEGYSDRLQDPSLRNCAYGRLFGPAAANATQVSALVDPVFATTNTPLDTTLRYSAEFFKNSDNRRVMLVLTDGIETCLGDPALAITELRNKGIEVIGIKYGETNDERAKEAFKAMDRFVPANSEDEIKSAMENVVKDVVEKSCKPILRLYRPGDIDGDILYTIQAGQSVRVTRGTYDAVVDYCTGKQTFLDQKIETDRGFDFNLDCKKQ